MISSNPLDAVAAVRMPDPDIQIWEPSAVRHFLETARGHRFYAAYFLTLSLGLRLGEVRGLKWSDIEGSMLHIQRTLSGDQAVPKFGPPKTKKGDRFLPLPPDDVTAGRLVQLGPFVFPSAIFLYSLAFTLRDTVHTVGGWKVAKALIWAGLIAGQLNNSPLKLT